MKDELLERLWESDAASALTNAAARRIALDAAKITEAQATIARQQVMLDRALEDIGEKMVEIGRLRAALSSTPPE